MNNPNDNCLDEMRCPMCGSYGPFYIGITTVVLVEDYGITDEPNDKVWDGSSSCACSECQYPATVADFVEGAEQ